MPAAWFLAPFIREPNDIAEHGHPYRYCIVRDLHREIAADNGKCSYSEVLGNYAIVKVLASTTTLQAIAALTGVRRLPVDRLDDPLSSLTNAQRTTLRDWIESLGYPRAEWQTDLGTDLGSRTLREVLMFIAKRRLRPRYDSVNDQVVLDGPEQPVRPLGDLDFEIGQ